MRAVCPRENFIRFVKELRSHGTLHDGQVALPHSKSQVKSSQVKSGEPSLQDPRCQLLALNFKQPWKEHGSEENSGNYCILTGSMNPFW